MQRQIEEKEYDLEEGSDEEQEEVSDKAYHLCDLKFPGTVTMKNHVNTMHGGFPKNCREKNHKENYECEIQELEDCFQIENKKRVKLFLLVKCAIKVLKTLRI